MSSSIGVSNHIIIIHHYHDYMILSLKIVKIMIFLEQNDFYIIVLFSSIFVCCLLMCLLAGCCFCLFDVCWFALLWYLCLFRVIWYNTGVNWWLSAWILLQINRLVAPPLSYTTRMTIDHIANLPNDAWWEGQGRKYGVLWEGKRSNLRPCLSHHASIWDLRYMDGLYHNRFLIIHYHVILWITISLQWPLPICHFHDHKGIHCLHSSTSAWLSRKKPWLNVHYTLDIQHA